MTCPMTLDRSWTTVANECQHAYSRAPMLQVAVKVAENDESSRSKTLKFAT